MHAKELQLMYKSVTTSLIHQKCGVIGFCVPFSRFVLCRSHWKHFNYLKILTMATLLVFWWYLGEHIRDNNGFNSQYGCKQLRYDVLRGFCKIFPLLTCGRYDLTHLTVHQQCRDRNQVYPCVCMNIANVCCTFLPYCELSLQHTMSASK